MLAVASVPADPAEKRDFVGVPFDWDHSSSGEIRVFYRLVGSDTTKPLLVFFNGGPGGSSADYVSLDRKANPLKELEHHFCLLLIDQRGTGFSAPLDLNSPQLDPRVVVRKFGSPQHARDAAAVIDHVVPPGGKFFLLAYSYGGQIGFQYLALSAARRPAGVVFAAPAVPYVDPIEAYLGRRMAQRDLNLAILGPRPDLQAKVLALKERVRREGYVGSDGTPLLPGMVSAWWRQLSRSPGVAEKLERWLDQYLDPKVPIAELNKDITTRLELTHNLLNGILVTTDLFGDSVARLVEKTDLLLAKSGKSFEPWMLYEGEAALTYGRRKTFHAGRHTKLLDSLDGLSSLRTVAPLDAVKRAFGQVPTLFIAGDSDMSLPFASEREQFEKLADPSLSRFVAVPGGGHGAVFTVESATLISDWAQTCCDQKAPTHRDRGAR
jgi:pimeloyl-ACP methyl ester carboxylesterase